MPRNRKTPRTRRPRGPSTVLAHQPRSASRCGSGISSTLMPCSKIVAHPEHTWGHQGIQSDLPQGGDGPPDEVPAEPRAPVRGTEHDPVNGHADEAFQIPVPFLGKGIDVLNRIEFRRAVPVGQASLNRDITHSLLTTHREELPDRSLPHGTPVYHAVDRRARERVCSLQTRETRHHDDLVS